PRGTHTILLIRPIFTTTLRSLLRRYHTGPALFVDGDVRERRIGNFYRLNLRRIAVGVDLPFDGDRRAADFHDIGIEAHDVAHHHRLLEHERVDRNGGHA